MTSIGTPNQKTALITIAGRRVKRWVRSPLPPPRPRRSPTSLLQLGKSLASTPKKPRNPTKRRRTISDATTSSSSLATGLLSLGLKSALKENEAGKVVHDVILPPET